MTSSREISKLKICFLVGSLAISGGTYVIVEHASFLSELGADVTLAVQEPFDQSTLGWHDKFHGLRCVPIEDGKDYTYDLVIATWWKTALELGNFSASQYGYFVQSIESRFYPEDETALRNLVNSTYRLPAIYVTEASWIKSHLEDLYGSSPSLVRNGIRKDIYRTDGSVVSPRNPQKPRVLIEGHFGVSFKNTALAVKLAHDAGSRDTWLLTGSSVTWVPYVSRLFAKVPISVTAEIYRSCDILLKLSTVEGMFGPPLEMFHCGGTCIVLNVTGHDEYIKNGVNGIVVDRNDIQGVVQAIRRLQSDTQSLEKLKEGARLTASEWPSWGTSSQLFSSWVIRCMSEGFAKRDIIKDMNKFAWERYVHDENERLSTTMRDRITLPVFNKFLRSVEQSLFKANPNFSASKEILLTKRIAK